MSPALSSVGGFPVVFLAHLVARFTDRDATCFLQIVKFCNYIVTHHSDGIEHDANVLTYLSGDSLHEKCIPNFSYTGILETIPVRFDQVANFYDKYKKK